VGEGAEDPHSLRCTVPAIRFRYDGPGFKLWYCLGEKAGQGGRWTHNKRVENPKCQSQLTTIESRPKMVVERQVPWVVENGS